MDLLAIFMSAENLIANYGQDGAERFAAAALDRAIDVEDNKAKRHWKAVLWAVEGQGVQ